ncbi:protein C10 [Anoplophora glabripennis]|uniref:protein C10 n=1 Tax=Anoplophora glabripennis TaxID=217634 RepID=UPI0008734F74|nr:protein C10 [Anoplophora glabripennis]XP_018577854.1 protein C10 [Anoplophora glabripennis]
MSKTDLTPVVAMEILNKTLEELQTPANVQKLEEARDNVGNEMLKMMQFLFPIVMQIQMDVIREYGYAEGREGIIKFSQMLRSLEREDPEISRLHSLIKSYYLPPVSVHTTSESPVEEKANST